MQEKQTSAASGRRIRTTTGQASCPATRHGGLCATAWAAHGEAVRPPLSACDVIEHCFHEQYAQCLPGDEEELPEAGAHQRQPLRLPESLPGGGACGHGHHGGLRPRAGRRRPIICHAGDSRAYLCPGRRRLTQLTHDHSYVQELVDCGTITAEEAEHHPQKNIITRALGVDYRL